MTRETTMDKQRLAAFADGELSPEEAAEVVMHLADHPADQAYVDEIMAANVALARAFSAPMDEPVPDSLRQLLLPAEQAGPKVVAFRPRPSRVFLASLASAGLAVAATLAALAVLPTAQGLKVGPVPAGSPLQAALDSQPSGAVQGIEDGRQLAILATLPARDSICREFEVLNAAADEVQLGLACRHGEGWTVDVLLAETLGGESAAGGYAPASGRDAGALDLWLDRRDAGMALDAAAEAAMMARGWQP